MIPGGFARPHQVAPAPSSNDSEAKDDELQQSRPAEITQSQTTEESGIVMQFPMFVIPVHKFLGLDKFLLHQELRRENMLVERDASMETVIFVSHQWTS